MDPTDPVSRWREKSRGQTLKFLCRNNFELLGSADIFMFAVELGVAGGL